jgi:hypothetical protein
MSRSMLWHSLRRIEPSLGSTQRFAACSNVSGQGVLLKTVTEGGTPSQNASCSPLESVITTLAFILSARDISHG